MLLMNMIYFFIACVVLVVAGTYLVKNLVKIAQFLRITEFAAAFIIMAVATSIPEFFVGIMSAISKNPALSFGNIIGANIIDLTLVMGIIIIASRNIKIRDKEIKKDAFFMSLIAIAPLVLFLIGNVLSRLDGLILLGVFFTYSYRMFKRQRKFSKKTEDGIKRYEIVFSVFFFILCLAVLFVSANFIVKYATLLAIDLALPQIMVGLFLVSIGTTLPELTFGVRAAMMGHGEMALGDQIGTVICNATLIIGIVALIQPITAAFAPFIIASAFLLLSCFLFMTFTESGNRLDTKEGISLILLYIFFVMVEFCIKGM
jgi:cation:H+ antiporter